MKAPILALRVSRRAVGAAVLRDESLTFLDGRHLTSTKHRAVAAAVRYLARVLELTTPHSLVLDAPHDSGSTTDQILAAFRETRGAIPCAVIPTADLLTAFGVPALASRAQLRDVARRLFPQAAPRVRSVTPYLLDAAALALLAETLTALGQLRT